MIEPRAHVYHTSNDTHGMDTTHDAPTEANDTQSYRSSRRCTACTPHDVHMFKRNTCIQRMCTHKTLNFQRVADCCCGRARGATCNASSMRGRRRSFTSRANDRPLAIFPQAKTGAKMNILGRRLARNQQADKSLILIPGALRHGRAPQLCFLIFQVVLFAGPQVDNCDQQSAFPAEVFDSLHRRAQACSTVVGLRPPGPTFCAPVVLASKLDPCQQ